MVMMSPPGTAPAGGADPDGLKKLLLLQVAVLHRLEHLSAELTTHHPAPRTGNAWGHPRAVPARPAVRVRERGRWGRAVHRYRVSLLAAGMAVFAVAAVVGPGVVPSLSSGGFDVIGSESATVSSRLGVLGGRPTPDVVAVYRSETLTVDSAAFRDAVQAVSARIPAAGIRSMSTYWTTRSPALVSADRHATLLALQLSGSQADQLSRYAALRPLLAADPAVVTTRVGGVTAVTAEINDRVSADLATAESITAPVVGLLLLAVFGSAVAALLPLLIGGITVVVSLTALRVLTQVTDVSIFALNIVTLLGLGLSIDYALLIVTRYREELRAGHPVREALARTMTTAGRSVAVSSLLVSVSLSGLVLLPTGFLRSMAYGGVAAVSIAAVSSLTILPAVLAVLGPRINAWRVPLLSPAPPRERPAGSPRAAAVLAQRRDRWAGLARAVMRRPVLVALGVSALLLALALPVLHVRFGGIDERQLPASAPSRVAADAVTRDFPGVQLDPVEVLVQGGDRTVWNALVTQISAIPEVRGVRVAASGPANALIDVTYAGVSTDAPARSIVTAIRALTPPPGTTVSVGGTPAQQVDLRRAVTNGLPLMLLLVAAATFTVLFWAYGSFVLPVKAMLMNALTVSAALGIVVLVFQDGYLSSLLGFTSTGSIELSQPILVLAIVFGLSTDYEVFLLSRIREEWDATGDNAGAVAAGVQRTGPIITNAAALILVVIAAFSTSGILFIKLIGIAMLAAIILDATVVRALLVPATMRLMGQWNWWSPGPVLRWWQRHRPATEELPGHPDPGHPDPGLVPVPASPASPASPARSARSARHRARSRFSWPARPVERTARTQVRTSGART